LVSLEVRHAAPRMTTLDIITARLNVKSDSHVASRSSLRLNDVRITPEMVKEHERILTSGFYSEVTLGYQSDAGTGLKNCSAHPSRAGIDSLLPFADA
jgi:predicted ATP-dependent Lon-type protease